MKPILKLIALEAWYLKKTILIIGVILIAFVAALLSVVSVYLDVPDGLYSGLNESAPLFSLSVKNKPLDYPVADGYVSYAAVSGLTQYCVLQGSKECASTPHNAAEEDAEQAVSIAVSVYAVPFEHAEEIFSHYQGSGTSIFSALPLHPGELIINPDIAKLAGVKVGETLTISPDLFFADREGLEKLKDMQPQTFNVVGYLNTTPLNTFNKEHREDAYLPSAHVLLIPYDTPVCDSATYLFTDSKVMHLRYLDLMHEGVTSTMQSTVSAQVENIAVARAFFLAVSLVLGLMVIFILYSLIAIFFRQRKNQICRLKLLGATNGKIAGIYCCIAVFLVIVAVIFGALFSIAFNLYFIDLCGHLFTMFSADFVSHFHISIPLITLVALSFFSVLLFFRTNRKVKNAAIAQEVRHE